MSKYDIFLISSFVCTVIQEIQKKCKGQKFKISTLFQAKIAQKLPFFTIFSPMKGVNFKNLDFFHFLHFFITDNRNQFSNPTKKRLPYF